MKHKRESASSLPSGESLVAVAAGPIVTTDEDDGSVFKLYALEYVKGNPKPEHAAYVRSEIVDPEHPNPSIPNPDRKSGTLIKGVVAWAETGEPSDESPVVYEKFIDSTLAPNALRVRLAHWRAERQIIDSLRTAEARSDAVFVGMLSPLTPTLQSS